MNGNIYQVWKYNTRWGSDYRIGDKGIFNGYRKGYILIPRDVRHSSELVGYVELKALANALGVKLQLKIEDIKERNECKKEVKK